MNELIGWIGSIMFSLCGLPQAWACYKQGHSQGISKAFIAMWLIGEVCFVAYTLTKFGLVWPLLVNYLVNIFFILVIVKFMVFPNPSRTATHY